MRILGLIKTSIQGLHFWISMRHYVIDFQETGNGAHCTDYFLVKIKIILTVIVSVWSGPTSQALILKLLQYFNVTNNICLQSTLPGFDTAALELKKFKKCFPNPNYFSRTRLSGVFAQTADEINFSLR